jgi:hypothetical protein
VLRHDLETLRVTLTDPQGPEVLVVDGQDPVDPKPLGSSTSWRMAGRLARRK